MHRDAVLFPLLLTYVTALVVGAMVDTVRPASLDGPHHASLAALAQLGVFPGMAVFIGDDSKEVQKATCVVVVGRRGTEERVLYERMDDCDGPGVRVFVDRFNMVLQRSVDAAVGGVRNDDAVAIERTVGAVASYFCRSPLVGNFGAETVSVVQLKLKRHYDTGEVSSRSYLMSHWSCADGREWPQPWPSLREVLPDAPR